MKIGILGGTFDPVHIAHMRLAEEAKYYFNLDKILFLPSNIPPHKTNKKISNYLDRIKLLELAIKGRKDFELELHDINLETPSYTVDTLKFLKTKYSDNQLFFIIGMDLFKELNTWKNFLELFKLSNFIVARRPPFMNIDFQLAESFMPPFTGENINNFVINEKKEVLEHISGNNIYFFKSTRLDISSTEIRKLISKGVPVNFLVPDRVVSYITEKKLYKE